jgi:hypothetical protein
MRKGILSLLGGGRSRQKSKNMQQAEKAAVKPPVAAEVAKADAKTQEKPFVQTINVPKQRSLLKGTKRRMGIGLTRSHNKPGVKK